MTKIGMIQTVNYQSNEKCISRAASLLRGMGEKEAEIVCLPEQWLKNNEIDDFDKEFLKFKEIANEFSMTVIPGAFYETVNGNTSIVAPIIGPDGEFLGKQEKIHPFDYERKTVTPGKEAKVFKTSCKFGVMVCYDMVFPDVANTLARKGAQILLSPSRIVKRGIIPWQMYVQVRALENRIPIVAVNVESHRFGGGSMIVDLKENNMVFQTNVSRISGEGWKAKELGLEKFEQGRKSRYSDFNRFR